MPDKGGTTYCILYGPFGFINIFWLPVCSDPIHTDGGVENLNTTFRVAMRINELSHLHIAII